MFFYFIGELVSKKAARKKKEGDCHDGPNQTGGNKIQLNLGCTHKLPPTKTKPKKKKKKEKT
jgi:hypothetical protein